MKITVIDYGLSNLLSVRRAFEYFGAEVEVTGSRSRILSAKALVLPGVGAFKDGMAGLSGLSLADAIADKCAVGTPLLGICLGMQMLFDESDEFGRHRGLGLIPGRVERIPGVDTDGAPQRVPHVGWAPFCRRRSGAEASEERCSRMFLQAGSCISFTVMRRSPPMTRTAWQTRYTAAAGCVRRRRRAVSSAASSTRRKAESWGFPSYTAI